MKYTLHGKIDLTQELCIQIGEVYVSCGWGDNHDWKVIQNAFLHTDYYRVVFVPDSTPVGFIRAFTDGAFTTWVAEIIVKKEHQRQGIGTRLMATFAKDFEQTSIYALPFYGTEKIFNEVGIISRKKLLAHSRAPQA